MKYSGATAKGVITGLLIIMVSCLFFYVLKLPENGKSQMLGWMIYIAGILWSLAAFKQAERGTAAFKDYFSEGFKTFIVVTFFIAVFTIVFYKLNPQLLENTIKENNALVFKEGDHTPDEIEKNADRLRSIFIPMMVAIKTMLYLFVGSVITLIAAAILRRRKA